MQKAMLLLVATFQTILMSYLLSAVAPYIPQGRRHYGVWNAYNKVVKLLLSHVCQSAAGTNYTREKLQGQRETARGNLRTTGEDRERSGDLRDTLKR